MIVSRAVCMAAMLAFMALAGASGAKAQGAQLFSVLLGGNEVKSPTSANPDGGVRAGDLDGFGTASLVITDSTSLCFTLAVHKIDKPSAAHIHRGTAGLNGAVVVALAPPTSPGGGSPGVTSGCTSGLSSALLTEIRMNPSGFYVNIHTTSFPGGALRGQLF